MKYLIGFCILLLFYFGCKTSQNAIDKEANNKLLTQYKIDTARLNEELRYERTLKNLNSNEVKREDEIHALAKASASQEPKKDIAVKSENKEAIKQQARVVSKIVYQDKSKMLLTNSSNSKVAFYCPVEMREETTYEASAILGLLIQDNEIKSELLKLVNESRAELNESPLTINDIVSKDIELGHYIKVKLVDPGNKFEIKVLDNYPAQDSMVKIYDEASQTFNKHTYIWKWLVTPKANTSGSARLIVSVSPFNKQLQALAGRERNFAIKIRLKKTFTQKLIEHATAFPEWTFGSVIAPVISFLVGVYMEKKKKKESIKENIA